MGIFGSLFKKEITKIEKNDTFSNGELANLMKQKNGQEILEDGAENGNLACQQLLYTLHMIGAKVDKFNKDKFEYYTKLAAHQNDSTAQMNYAKIIYDSIEELKSENMEKNGGVPKDSILNIKDKLEESLIWYKKAYRNGNQGALKSINNIEIKLLKDWIDPIIEEYYE